MICCLKGGVTLITLTSPRVIACENIRFSSLFASGDVSGSNVSGREERGETDVFAGYAFNKCIRIKMSRSENASCLLSLIGEPCFETQNILQFFIERETSGYEADICITCLKAKRRLILS